MTSDPLVSAPRPMPSNMPGRPLSFETLARSAARRRRRFRGEVSEMAKLFLPEPDSRPWSHDPDPRPWEDDVDAANYQAQLWAEQWLGPKQVAAWLKAWPRADPKIAAGFARAGIAPDVAMTRLWYGKIHPGRHPLAVRVAIRDLTLDDAIQQLRAANLVGPTAASDNG